MIDVFNDYYCTTYREYYGDPLSAFTYLCINRRVDIEHITAFRYDYKLNYTISIKHHAGWETYAPLIVEYCVNVLGMDNILMEEYNGD